jgi:anaerobic selenocysteine-containing dehydrogenase
VTARREQRSFCRLCAAVCGIVVTTEDDRVVRVRGDADHPVSRGYTCPKGRALGALHHHPDRLDRPLRRRAGRLAPVAWDAWLDDLAAGVARVVDRSGPDAVAVYRGTASYFDGAGSVVAERFVRALGTRSRYTTSTLDQSARLLVAERMAGASWLLPLVDHERVTLTVLIGTNPVVSHGHVEAWSDPVRRLRALTARGEVWVVDPRRSETVRLATHHLAPRPGSEPALLAHLVREVLAAGVDVDDARVRAADLDVLGAAVAPYDGAAATAATGVSRDALASLVAAVLAHERVAVQTGTGVTMARGGAVAEWLAWVLAVLRGSIDRPGGMWCNPGRLDRLARVRPGPVDSRVPGPRSRPDLAGRFGQLPAAGLADEIVAGEVGALLVLGGNPVRALPDGARFADACRSLDVLMVADIVRGDTVAQATHVAPCSGALERPDVPVVDVMQPAVVRQHTPAVVARGAERRPLWWVVAGLAARLGLDGVLPSGLDLDAPDDEVVRRTAGLAPDAVPPHGAVLESGPVFGWVRDRLLPEGRWSVAPADLVAALAAWRPPAGGHVLVPVRRLGHVNSTLSDLGPEGAATRSVGLAPEDAAAAGLGDGALARVASAHGEVVAPVRLDPSLAAGTVAVPHGVADPDASRLVSDRVDLDPATGMPRLGGVPVTVTPFAAPS